MKPAQEPWTLEEFLAWEPEQPKRYEFADGVVRLMTGGSANHARIKGNVYAFLHGRLPRGCEAFVEGPRLKTASGSFYPDVVVVCASVEGQADTLTSAKVIVEVLSGSTADFDRGPKWLAYQTIDDLAHYVLISQAGVKIELYSRAASGWSYAAIEGTDQELALDAVGVRIPIAAIYASTSIA